MSRFEMHEFFDHGTYKTMAPGSAYIQIPGVVFPAFPAVFC